MTSPKSSEYLKTSYLCDFDIHPEIGAKVDISQSVMKKKALETPRKAETEFRDMGMAWWLRKTQELLATVEG